MADVKLMVAAGAGKAKVKASGGIRDWKRHGPRPARSGKRGVNDPSAAQRGTGEPWPFYKCNGRVQSPRATQRDEWHAAACCPWMTASVPYPDRPIAIELQNRD